MTKAELEWHRAITGAVVTLLQRGLMPPDSSAGAQAVADAMAKLEEEQEEPFFPVKGLSEEIRQGAQAQADGAKKAATVCECDVCKRARDTSGPARTSKPLAAFYDLERALRLGGHAAEDAERKAARERADRDEAMRRDK